MNLELSELKIEDLHKFWPFLSRGVQCLKRKHQPDWLPEDVYAALRHGQASCVIAHRAHRLLGYSIYTRQLRPFNFTPELFIWITWTIPLKERLPGDDMSEVIDGLWNYMVNVARTQYASSQLTWATRPGRARAFGRKYDWHSSWVTISVKAELRGTGSG